MSNNEGEAEEQVLNDGPQAAALLAHGRIPVPRTYDTLAARPRLIIGDTVNTDV